MNRFENLRVDRSPQGVMTVTIDVVDRSVNIFDEPLLRELAALVEGLHRWKGDGATRLVVFRSGKSSGFLAGADLHRLPEIGTAEEAESILKLGQELFRQVETLPIPTIAVIHGPCLGGGLEFALACRYRVARDDAETRLGLPETQLGLIPGWGGTQRLPRLVGLAAAASMILEGRRLTASQALSRGLIDAAFAPATFEADVSRFVEDCLAHRLPQRRSRGWLAWLRDETPLGQRLVLWWARHQIRTQAGRYPALPGALRAMEAGLREGLETGLAAERQEFCRALFTPACRNLLELFLQRERARKRSTWVGELARPQRDIRTIAVLGAGTMGAGIAQLAATQGYLVLLKDVDAAAVQQGWQRIESLTQRAVSRGVLRAVDAERVRSSITTTTESQMLAKADLVIEAIVERLDVKQQAFGELDELLPSETILVSNTSALPISQMAAVTNRADRVAGLHFFNPVHKMPLVEIVRCPQTSEATVAALVDVVRQLGKTPLVVAEGPGFLVNRILFPYLDEAVRLADEGVPVEQIDREAKRFGMPMGPLELLDAVGLDVAADVAQTLAALSREESPTPQRLAELVAAGHKGQKSGRGFYTYKNGRRGKPAFAASAPVTGTLPESRDFAGETLSGIQQRLVLSLINAAADCLHDGIVTEHWMADLGLVLGTGFAPFRGGPLKLLDHWGWERVVEALQELSRTCGPRFRPSEEFGSLPLSPTARLVLAILEV